MWKAAASYNNLTGARQLGAVEMVGLNRFICGLSSNEISQLNVDEFKCVSLYHFIHGTTFSHALVKGIVRDF